MSSQSNIQAFRPVTNHTKAYTASSAATTTAFSEGTHVARIVSTTDCFITFAAAPIATVAAGAFIVANTPEYFIVDAGMKVAAIRSVVDGTIYVSEMSK